MSLVFNNVRNEPQTHVFLIGIDYYRYLNGGANEKEQEFAGQAQLGQLTSPSASISAIYNEILRLHKEQAWIKPLGSIELLLSPSPRTDPLPGINKEAATIGNIKQAYFKWKKRCDQHKDNVAMFYYCGHGLEKGKHYLLAEDFGAIPENPWSEAFDFDTTRNAFHNCKAETQLFFVDACREITDDMWETDLTIAPIDQPRVVCPESLYNLTMKATANSEAAYGRRNTPSFFSQALIKALSGQVAKKYPDSWVVETTAICQHIYTLFNLVEPAPVTKQRCQNSHGNVTPLLEFKTAPEVLLEISCDPEHALAFASLSCHQPSSRKKFKRDPTPEPWEVRVPAGIYKLVAEFQNKKFRSKPIYTSAEPPMKQEKIKCK